MITLREMDPTSFGKYARFSFDIFKDELQKTSGKSTDEINEMVGEAPSKPGEDDLWRVIVFDAKEIGFLWVRLNKEKKEAFGYDIYLEEEFRGRGYGKLIMREGLELLKQMGISKLNIRVFDENKIARSLYKTLGFIEEKRSEELKQTRLFLLIQ